MSKCENTDNQCVCGKNEGSGNSCYYCTPQITNHWPIIDHRSTGNPDCCGCWVFEFDRTGEVYLSIRCNECGEKRVLLKQFRPDVTEPTKPVGGKWAVKTETWDKLVDEKLDLERRVESHIKGEGCKRFCPDCGEPSWFVDDEDMTCLFCGHKGFPVPDIDAEQIA